MSHRNYTYLKVLIETFDNNRKYIKFIISLYLCSYRYKRLCNINFIFNVVNNVLLPIRMLFLCTNFYIHISGLRFIVRHPDPGTQEPGTRVKHHFFGTVEPGFKKQNTRILLPFLNHFALVIKSSFYKKKNLSNFERAIYFFCAVYI